MNIFRPRRFLDPSAAHLAGSQAHPRAALLLDRDGIINLDRGYVHAPDQTEWVPGIFELVAGAAAAGMVVVVVTNQAGIARGYYSEKSFLQYTAWMHDQFNSRGVPLLATYYCPHHPGFGGAEYRGECSCRKPRHGMLLALAEELVIDLGSSVMLGDKLSDIEAAATAGVGAALYAGGGRLANTLDIIRRLL